MCVLVTAVWTPAIASAGAQSAPGGHGEAEAEIERLQAASRHEGMGELEAAERLLREVLEGRSESIPALLALERVLRIQRRLEELPPLVEAALEEDRRSALLNQLLVRTYSELDRVAELESAARRWVETVPAIEIPYREVARVWESRGEYGRARAVLEEGRRRVDAPDALALELGDLFATLGEPRLAVREWDRSIDGSGRGLSQVRRRLRSLPDGGEVARAELVEMLSTDPRASGRMNAALELAVEGGLEERARSILDVRLPELAPAERRNVLDDVARRADAGGHQRLAYWAYDRLLELESGRTAHAGRLVALRNRLAELAVELGDTAAAATRYQAVEDAFAAGSPQRRQAAAARIELLAAHDPDHALRLLTTFRAEHPDWPETDRLVAAVAGALLAEEREEEVATVLAGVEGPRSSLLRARLMLLRGDLEGARLALMTAAPSLRGVEATAALSLVGLLGRVSVRAGTVLGEALGLRERGEPGEAVDRVTEAVDVLEPGDIPPLLDFAAGMADQAGLVADARSLRRRLLEEHPRSHEAPGALLALARGLAEEDGSGPEARELLERLIIEHPRSALVPQARRALERLDRLHRGGVA